MNTKQKRNSGRIDFIADNMRGVTVVSFDPEYLEKDSAVYNHDLAKFCAQLSLLSYDREIPLSECDYDTGSYIGNTNTKPNVYKVLTALGFENTEIDISACRDGLCYVMANRKVNVDNKDYDLIFISFVGSVGAQWYSNFDPLGVDSEFEYSPQEIDRRKSLKSQLHFGFDDARKYVYDRFCDYVDRFMPKLNPERTKVILTGHSRGAAAANLFAMQLINYGENINDGLFPAGRKIANKENIYTYALATPNYIRIPKKEQQEKDPLYCRIFNFENPEDFVTKVLPSEWCDFGKVGTSLVFPSVDNEPDNYRYYLYRMQKYYARFSNGEKYHHFPKGEENVYDLVQGIVSKVHSIDEFYNLKLSLNDMKASVQEFFIMSLCTYLAETGEKQEKANQLMVNAFAQPVFRAKTSPVILKINDFFVVNEGLSSVPVAGAPFQKYFSQGHMAITYCSFIMSMNGDEMKFRPSEFYKKP